MASTSMSTASQLVDLTGTLYDAGLGTSSWAHALDKLAAAFGGLSANLAFRSSVPDNTSKVVAIGVDDSAVESFEQHYAFLNPIFSAIPRLPVGAPFTDAMVAPREATRRGEFYND